jgi:hypothetical protein
MMCGVSFGNRIPNKGIEGQDDVVGTAVSLRLCRYWQQNGSEENKKKRKNNY